MGNEGVATVEGFEEDGTVEERLKIGDRGALRVEPTYARQSELSDNAPNRAVVMGAPQLGAHTFPSASSDSGAHRAWLQALGSLIRIFRMRR